MSLVIFHFIFSFFPFFFFCLTDKSGYESQMNSLRGKQQSSSYNKNIRFQTLQWFIFVSTTFILFINNNIY